jgi:predicted Zn-dependent protease
VTSPETGRKQLIAPSESYMNSMGAQAYADMLAKEKISHNAEQTSVMVDIGKRIARASGKGYDWKFTLFESKDVNAFCLPGGKVGVYTGIMPIAKTNAGLAAIMGHEVAHAVARHGAERMTQTLIVAGALMTVEQVMGDSKKKPYIMGALGLGAQFGVLLPYSRTHESEADDIGLDYMARAGFDPAESVELWHRMGKLGGNPPEFMSTHPDPARRAKELEAQLPRARQLYEKSQKVATVVLP